MAEKKPAGTTRKRAGSKGGVSAAEAKRRQRQAQEATGEPTLPTGESAADVRAAIEEARKAVQTGRTLGEAEAGGATVTSISELRARARGELLQMPSGLVGRVRRPGMIALLQSGTIPNVLMPLVEKGLEAGSRGQTVTMEEIAGEVTPEMMGDMLSLFDLVTMFIVVEPRLRPDPEKCDACGSIKDLLDTGPEKAHKHDWRRLEEHEWPETHPVTGEELAYVSWIPFEDKQFLWNYAAGGTRSIDQFREDQQATPVGTL